tara:strand:+ start:3705 stop:4277 length:573 start_codon:yes stop_codon:yes gene_type:complete
MVNAYHPRKASTYLDVVIDNGAYSAFKNGSEWDEARFLGGCEYFLKRHVSPLWVVVPDVVGDPVATLKLWECWSPYISEHFGWPLAFAVQDGMSVFDVPELADVVFVGGSTEWKWGNVYKFSSAFPRVHVGRVNSLANLWFCHDAGVESVDGTGWTRTERQKSQLEHYLRCNTGWSVREEQLTIDGSQED